VIEESKGSKPTELPEAGVGIIYSPEIEPLLGVDGLVQALEIEPQTVWIQISSVGEKCFKDTGPLLEYLAGLPGKKLVHSVGAPVGGSLAPPLQQTDLLRQWVQRLQPAWASEHLAFNCTLEFHTGFFLAPRQTWTGVESVTNSIRQLQKALPVPVAVETGVNYLRPRRDELPDGQFIAEVARAANCGILLDLHNVFTNALNGRQSVEEFLNSIPLERVWELHIAGGMEMDGFWLDGHCDVIPDTLMDITRRLLPALSQVRALIFEVFPSFVAVMGLNKIRAQLERLHEAWRERGRSRGDAFVPSKLQRSNSESDDNGACVTSEHWETTFGRLVIGREPDGSSLSLELAADPGVHLIRKLVREFRASMLVNVLRLTMRLVLLTLREEGTRTLLLAFWERTPPQMYASTEAEKFGDFLESLNLQVPHLAKILAFERAILATTLDDQIRIIPFDFDPVPLLRALAEGRLPEMPGQPGSYEIEVTSDVATENNLNLAWLGPNTQGH
jgi:uncharacterized protein